MLEEYEKLLKGKTGTWRAITKKTVMNLSTEVDACVKQMESAQIEYCKLAEIDINRRGTGYIPFTVTSTEILPTSRSRSA